MLPQTLRPNLALGQAIDPGAHLVLPELCGRPAKLRQIADGIQIRSLGLGGIASQLQILHHLLA